MPNNKMAVPTGEELCHSLPAVEIDYQAKGRWLEGAEGLGGLKTYFSSTKPSKKAIVYLYDIGGFCSQNFQGADILASAGYDVFIPDVHQGESLDFATFVKLPAEEKAPIRAKFDAGWGGIPKNAERMPQLIDELRRKGYERVAGCGFCWGGNVVALVPQFDALAMIHFGKQVNAAAAEKINVPTCLLPSMNEDEDLVNGFQAVIKAKPFGDRCVLKWYRDQLHGFTAARGDLNDPKTRAAYADVFATLTAFFNGNL